MCRWNIFEVRTFSSTSIKTKKSKGIIHVFFFSLFLFNSIFNTIVNATKMAPPVK